ncbi:uncharacterized protein C8A04DRAFT_11363 [Dichotomopilus funicola]|uniref:Apple domain-containing protein n=1 Tax=Dichotomopilus funicola TaxID=1934379 RepID=A0AAN6ZNV3_9PEZI|nr:hypothetical protein C8A04DRAFT_11363 [Dichotomopilus funicola]
MALFKRQQNRAPCPGGNGTTIGSVQEFTTLCNTALDGDVLMQLPAFDFTTCVDICSSSHPKCDGATFSGGQCMLMANIRRQSQRRRRTRDSAIASFPNASSNCVTLGGSQRALGTNFTTMCGFIINGSDIGQNFAPTFQDCLGQCAATRGCAAVSYDPSLNLGFKNCYLKTNIANPNTIAADRRTDSALVAAAAADPASSSPPPPPTSTSSPSPAPPPPPPSSSSGGGGVFFTPPPGATTNPAPPPTTTPPPISEESSPIPSSLSLPSPSESTPSATSTTSTTSTPPVLNTIPFIFPIPTPSPSDSTAPDASGSNSNTAGTDTSNMAWVAAPVVGGVAAIALVAVSFIMLRRRRRGNGGQEKRKAYRGGSGGEQGYWAGQSRAGNFAQVEALGRRSMDVRGSVVGFMTGRPMGMERLEDIEEGEGRTSGEMKNGGGASRGEGVGPKGNGRTTELRASYNGLGQNKWPQ